MDNQAKINEARNSLPPFENWFMDKVVVPIVEPSIVIMTDSYIPTAVKTKTVIFRKNYYTKEWDFDSKNFD